MRGFYKQPITAFTIIVLLQPVALLAQQTYLEGLQDISKRWELSLTTGFNNFLGDIGGNRGIGKPFVKDYTFKTGKPFIGLSGTFNLNQFVALQAGFNIASVTAADSLINNTGDMERWRYYRNLSFKSNITEAYISAVVYPTMYFARTKVELHKIVPFISAGIGVFHFNPQAQLNGAWVNLQPLSLEGQGFPEYPDRKPYSLTQLYLPASLGVKYYFTNRWAFSTGMLMRKTFTDYIDDISTTYIDPALFYQHLPADKAALATQLYSRSITPWKVKPDIAKANSNDKDTYLTFFVTLSIRLNKYIPFYYPKL